MLPDNEGDSARLLRAAVAYYDALGVIIREVLTYNGACYRCLAHAWVYHTGGEGGIRTLGPLAGTPVFRSWLFWRKF